MPCIPVSHPSPSFRPVNHRPVDSHDSGRESAQHRTPRGMLVDIPVPIPRHDMPVCIPDPIPLLGMPGIPDPSTSRDPLDSRGECRPNTDTPCGMLCVPAPISSPDTDTSFDFPLTFRYLHHCTTHSPTSSRATLDSRREYRPNNDTPCGMLCIPVPYIPYPAGESVGPTLTLPAVCLST